MILPRAARAAIATPTQTGFGRFVRAAFGCGVTLTALSPRTRGDVRADVVRKFLYAAIAIIGLVGPHGPAFAQDTPFVPDEWKFGRRQAGSTLQYCLDTRDPDLPVARKIGQAIAQALLLEPKPHEVGQNTVGEDIDNLYRVFLESCDVYLGFKLIPDAYPAMARGDAALLPNLIHPGDRQRRNGTHSPTCRAPRRSAPPSGPARISGSSSICRRCRRTAAGAGFRWDRTNSRCARSCATPSGPRWCGGRRSGRCGKAIPHSPTLRIISSKPLPDSAVDVGATLLARESFLRSNVDQAIASLTADGTIQSILDGEKFPAAPVK